MTVTLVKPVTRWGVQFEGSPSPDHVTAAESEADARRFHDALVFCGNTDARLVTDDGTGWHPAPTGGAS